MNARAPVLGNRSPREDAVRSAAIVDTCEPDLPPVWIDAPGAKQSPRAHVAAADGTLQHDAVSGQRDHLSGLLIDDLVNALQDPELLPAVLHHLGIEMQAAILAARVQRGFDLFLPLYTH